MADVQAFNEEINDGMGDVSIVVRSMKKKPSVHQFEKIKEYLTNQYPELDGHIRFEEIKVSPVLSIGMKCLEVFSLAIVFFTIVCQYVPFQNEYLVSISQFLVNNRFIILFFCYFAYSTFSETIYNRFFEVYFDDELAYSKMASFRFPTESDIKDLLISYLRRKHMIEKKTILLVCKKTLYNLLDLWDLWK